MLSKRKLWGLYLGQFGVVAVQWFFPHLRSNIPRAVQTHRADKSRRAGISAVYGSIRRRACQRIHLQTFLLRRGVSVTMARKIPLVTGLALASTIFVANWSRSTPRDRVHDGVILRRRRSVHRLVLVSTVAPSGLSDFQAECSTLFQTAAHS